MKNRSSSKQKRPKLTVAVPAYNVGEYLKECLQSLVSIPSKDLEIIVINDGSTDKTLEVAGEFAAKHSNVSIISKQNGGHGSAINAALRRANGIYFKVVDGDDMVDITNFMKFITLLGKTHSDIVLSDYQEYYMVSGSRRSVHNYSTLRPNKEYLLEEIAFYSWGPLLSTTTFKTDLYTTHPFSLDEKCYYVDQEYNYFVYRRSSTLTYLPLDLYIYRLERPSQSMNKSGFIKNYRDHEKVCLRLVHELVKEKPGDKKYTYLFENIVAPLCRSHYQILIELLRSRPLFLEFDEKLKKYGAIYNSPLVSGKIISVHRRTHGGTIPANGLLRKVGGALSHLGKK